MNHTAKDRVTVSRGDLDTFQVFALDAVLESHGHPATSPYKVIDNVIWACIKCGSIGETSNNSSRDHYASYIDPCCGLTVVFHSDDRCLVDPARLTIVKGN